jgi:hypothetical protein
MFVITQLILDGCCHWFGLPQMPGSPKKRWLQPLLWWTTQALGARSWRFLRRELIEFTREILKTFV